MARPGTRLPVVFLGHGNPMYAIQSNRYTEAWADLGETLARPTAIVAVSAHWFEAGTAVTSMAHPRTIHDFGGFPDALFQVEYPAPGSPALADRLRAMLDGSGLMDGPTGADLGWGLDHGTWSVLRHLYPSADVPVVQLSIDAGRPGADHRRLGSALTALRHQGVLVVASGNVVHNLAAAQFGDGVPAADWASRFEDEVALRLVAGDWEGLDDPASFGPDARRSVPTPEHYLPLLYALGAATPDEPVRIITRGIDAASISMLSVVVG